MTGNVWKHMYLKLAGSVADAIEVLPEIPEARHAKKLLIGGMRTAEDIYMRTGEPELEEMEEASL